MPVFKMRSWQTQTLRAYQDYLVEAPDEAAAARLLSDAQDEAQDDGHVERVVGVRRILAHGNGRPTVTEEGVRQLDPNDIDGSETGVTLIADDGSEIREVLPAPPDYGRRGGRRKGCRRLRAGRGVGKMDGMVARDDWRAVAAGLAIESLDMGMRIVRVGLEANPFSLRTMRAGQAFEGPRGEDDGPEAPEAGLYAEMPFEGGWKRACAAEPEAMADAITAMLAGLGDRLGPEVIALAEARMAERLDRVRAMPSASQAIAVGMAAREGHDG